MSQKQLSDVAVDNFIRRAKSATKSPQRKLTQTQTPQRKRKLTQTSPRRSKKKKRERTRTRRTPPPGFGSLQMFNDKYDSPRATASRMPRNRTRRSYQTKAEQMAQNRTRRSYQTEAEQRAGAAAIARYEGGPGTAPPPPPRAAARRPTQSATTPPPALQNTSGYETTRREKKYRGKEQTPREAAYQAANRRAAARKMKKGNYILEGGPSTSDDTEASSDDDASVSPVGNPASNVIASDESARGADISRGPPGNFTLSPQLQTAFREAMRARNPWSDAELAEIENPVDRYYIRSARTYEEFLNRLRRYSHPQSRRPDEIARLRAAAAANTAAAAAAAGGGKVTCEPTGTPRPPYPNSPNTHADCKNCNDIDMITHDSIRDIPIRNLVILPDGDCYDANGLNEWLTQEAKDGNYPPRHPWMRGETLPFVELPLRSFLRGRESVVPGWVSASRALRAEREGPTRNWLEWIGNFSRANTEQVPYYPCEGSDNGDYPVYPNVPTKHSDCKNCNEDHLFTDWGIREPIRNIPPRDLIVLPSGNCIKRDNWRNDVLAPPWRRGGIVEPGWVPQDPYTGIQLPDLPPDDVGVQQPGLPYAAWRGGKKRKSRKYKKSRKRKSRKYHM